MGKESGKRGNEQKEMKEKGKGKMKEKRKGKETGN